MTLHTFIRVTTLLFALCPSVCFGDVLTLKDGTVLQGEVISESSSQVRIYCKIKGKNEVRTIARSLIASLEITSKHGTKSSAKPPSKPPTAPPSSEKSKPSIPPITPPSNTPPASTEPSKPPTAPPSSEKSKPSIPPITPPSNTPPASTEPSNTASSNSEIIASAVGATRDQALASAQLTAVEQALGRLIDVETIIENDTVIRDSVLSATNGFIERFTVLSETKEGDLFRVRIRATVQSGKLSERIKVLAKTTSTLEGANLQAEVRTKAKSREDQVKMLDGVLATLVQDVVGIRVIGKSELVGGVEVPKGMTRLRIPIEIAIDQKAWDDRMKRVLPLLDEFSVVKSSTPIQLAQQPPPLTREASDGSFLFSLQASALDSQYVFPPPGTLAQHEWFVIVNPAIANTNDDSGFAAWNKFYSACDGERVFSAQQAAKEELVHFIVLTGPSRSGSAEVSVYGLPVAFVTSILSNYSGEFLVRGKLKDAQGAELASDAIRYRFTKDERYDQKRGAGALSGYWAHDCHILMFGANVHGGSDQNYSGSERKFAILAPGLAHFNPLFFQFTRAFRGFVWVDISTEDLGKVTTVECTIEVADK